MREIKFRGQMVTGEWVYGLLSHDLPGSTAYYAECSHRICWHTENGGTANAPVKNGTVCQFTGLLDKNGVEVYEGDRLGGAVEASVHFCEKSHQWALWADDDYGCLCYRCNGDTELAEYEQSDLLVVGNIHQPEIKEPS